MFTDRSKREADFYTSRAHRAQTSQYSESILLNGWERHQLAETSSNLWQRIEENMKEIIVCVHGTCVNQ